MFLYIFILNWSADIMQTMDRFFMKKNIRFLISIIRSTFHSNLLWSIYLNLHERICKQAANHFYEACSIYFFFFHHERWFTDANINAIPVIRRYFILAIPMFFDFLSSYPLIVSLAWYANISSLSFTLMTLIIRIHSK